MEAKRTNYIKISLTDEEFDSLQRYSENINKPLSSSIRNIIDTMVDVSNVYAEIVKYYKQGIKEVKELQDAESEVKKMISEMPIADQIELYGYISKMNNLSLFAKDWKTTKEKVLAK
jgi:hypothetical protein